MLLEGTVSNVAAFGAFVDIGVHQDGLVHVSQLADRFVKDAREVVKTGDIVKVKVLEVDVARKRIALTMRLRRRGRRPRAGDRRQIRRPPAVAARPAAYDRQAKGSRGQGSRQCAGGGVQQGRPHATEIARSASRAAPMVLR